VDASVRIPAGSSKAREAVSQYLARARVSLQKLLVEEGGAVRVLYYTAYNPYFRTNAKLFSATDFIAELLQHLPGCRARLIHRYGVEAGSHGAGCAWQQSRRPAVRRSLGVLPRVPRRVG
jgi:hypothetical protein